MAAAQAEQPSGGAPADTEAASVAWVGQPTRQADGKTFFAGFASGGVEYGLGEHRLHTSALRLSLEAASVRRPAAEAGVKQRHAAELPAASASALSSLLCRRPHSAAARRPLAAALHSQAREPA